METTTITSAMIQLHRGSHQIIVIYYIKSMFMVVHQRILIHYLVPLRQWWLLNPIRVINVDVGDSEVEEYKKATKLNTRIIGVPVESNIDNVNDNDDDNNKENLPPKINKTTRNDYDAMINSFQENNNDWMCFFITQK